MKQFAPLLLFLALSLSSNAALKLQEVQTASNKVLVMVYRSALIKVDESNSAIADWKINEQPPAAINRYMMVANNSDHYVYLTLASPLVEGTQYAIKSPFGDTTITFTERTVYCQSIKTNQVAYSALCKTNFANFSIWLGDGGGKKIEGALPTYEVLEQFSGTKVTEGTLTEVGPSASSGDTVYKVDLSKVPEGGPYKVAIKGYGCSLPFGVGGDFSRRLAHVMFRGQYYQRCGCPIKAPYGLNIREKACHSVAYKTNFTGKNPEARVVVAAGTDSFPCYGGYHDAGDADRRYFHMANPIVNLMIYEAFPELFTDGQFNIPDKFDASYNIVGKGNGIPDIIDEAVWGTKFWEYMQNTDGSILYGTETEGYPEPFAKPLDYDTKKYGTIAPIDAAAAVGAGLFMHLARMVKPYDADYSAKLAARAEKSFTYISAKLAQPEKLYYYIQKYLYDGDAAAHEQIKTLKSAVDNYKNNLFKCHGYQLNDAGFDNPGYILSYIVEKTRPTDSSVVNYFKTAIKAAADANIAELTKYAYPIANNPTGTTWGHNVMQPYYACAPIIQWRLTKEQNYLDGACAMMNYLLGLNPLNLSYVTGLGVYQIHDPHDRESAYTASKGWGLKPGITIFGPGVIQLIGTATAPPTYPEMAKLPVERKFGDMQGSISTAEFTIFETMTHYSLYTVLANGGIWDETKDPYKQQTGTVSRPATKFVQKPSAKAFVAGNMLHVNMQGVASSGMTGTLFLLSGKKLLDFSDALELQGKSQCAVPLSSETAGMISNGVVLCRITAINGWSSVVRVVVGR